MPPKPKTKKKPIAKKSIVSKSTVKKPIRKKAPAKRKNKKGALKKNMLVLLAVALMIVFVLFGYFLGKNDRDVVKTSTNTKTQALHRSRTLLKGLSNIKEGQHKETHHEVLQVQNKIVPKTVRKTKTPTSVKHLSGAEKKVLLNSGDLPKLVIIIDDISHAKQMAAIRATGLKLTPAIFPPSELSMTSHTLARGSKYAMIHLPMESGSKQFNRQYKTLFINNSEQQMLKRVKELRKLFPRVRYVNNHTGSVFTDSYSAMYKLYEALREEGFTFVDSRTIGSSKVAFIASEFGDRYIARDIFIDNEHTVKSIHTQLRKAVALAKKRGHAIAIGHPHKITMQALSSASEILKDVELVYIDTLYGS